MGFPPHLSHLTELKNNEVLTSGFSRASSMGRRSRICCSFGIRISQRLQKVHPLLLLKNKIQFYILCTVSVYTLAYALRRVFFMAQKEFFTFLQEQHQNLYCCVGTLSKLQAFSLGRKKPNATLKEAKTNMKNFLNG